MLKHSVPSETPVDSPAEQASGLDDDKISVYFDTFGRPHSLYRELLECPPPGVGFVCPVNLDKGLAASFRSINLTKLFAWEILNGIAPPSLAMSIFGTRSRRPQDCRLTYSTGHLVFRDENWIVDCEHLGQFAGYNPRALRTFIRLISKRLENDNCQRILPWSKMAYETIRRNVGTRKILEKTQIVRLARRATPINRTSREHTEILFVGSVNFPSILTQGQRSVLEGISRFTGICSFASHENFESKGGREVFEVFSLLSRQYDRLRLTVRAKGPPDIRARYGANPNIRIVENPVSPKELDKMFLDADIFLFPSHMSPGMAFLDAMNYELPTVTIAACNNAEIVQHGKTGFVCATSERVPYWHANGLPAGNTFDHIKAIHTPDHDVVTNLASHVRMLIEDEALRTRMGREGKRLVETGEFSINHRNRALREIIEQTLHR